MAHRAFFVCLTFFFSISILTAQQSDEPLICFSRLTLTASGSYHYAPWKKYNESLRLVQEAVQYNPAYPYPSGSLEKVNGDLTYQIEVSYRVISSFAITLSAGWLQTESVIDFNNHWPGGSSAFHDSYNQIMWLSSYHYGVGIGYTHPVNEILELSTGVVVARYPATMDFQATYQPPMSAFLFSANLRETTFSARTHVEAHLTALRPFSIVCRVDFRWLTLKNLRGQGSETDIYVDPNGTRIGGPSTFEAQLGEAGGYFGLYIPALGTMANTHMLHQLWARTPTSPWWSTQQPTSLDLSGFGLSLGVSYAF